jgi:hypothetical protein
MARDALLEVSLKLQQRYHVVHTRAVGAGASGYLPSALTTLLFFKG